VIVVRDLVDGRTVSSLCEEISEENRVAVSTVRAKDCAEALLRVLALKPTAEEFAQYATAVLNQRLIRKLCDACKEAYAPTPQVLQQLRIPEGRVQAFYRPPQPTAENPNPEPCKECGGIGYKGRTGLFEFWQLDDGVREVLGTTPKLDLLRQAARKAGNRTMQEEGVLMVAKGVTSLPELMRVLKL
jgi:type II secretory ATPase GspE/PulE/Tfp pilus assembly ATPase PilB-like protein